MDSAPAQVGNHSGLAEGHAFKRRVVRHHGDGGLSQAGVGHPVRGAGPQLDQRLHFSSRAIINRDLMAGLDQIGRHAGPHVPQPDKSHFHNFIPACAVRLIFSRIDGFRLDLWPIGLKGRQERCRSEC